MGEIQSTGRTWQVPGRDFGIELTFRDGLPVLLLSGEIDVYTFPTLSHAIDEIIADGYLDIALDLYDVAFLDSGGISVLIRAHKILKELSGKLELKRVHGHAYRVLEITGLTDFLNIQRLNHDMAA